MDNCWPVEWSEFSAGQCPLFNQWKLSINDECKPEGTEERICGLI